MSKVHLPKFGDAELPSWHSEPVLPTRPALSLSCPSFVVAGARSDARHRVAMALHAQLQARGRDAVCVVATGSPDADSHLLSRNGAKLVFEAEAMSEAGVRTVRWLQLGATLESAMTHAALSPTADCNAWILIGNWFVRAVAATRTFWVEDASFRSRADAAARLVRDEVDLLVVSDADALIRRVVEDVFT